MAFRVKRLNNRTRSIFFFTFLDLHLYTLKFTARAWSDWNFRTKKENFNFPMSTLHLYVTKRKLLNQGLHLVKLMSSLHIWYCLNPVISLLLTYLQDFNKRNTTGALVEHELFTLSGYMSLPQTFVLLNF